MLLGVRTSRQLLVGKLSVYLHLFFKIIISFYFAFLGFFNSSSSTKPLSFTKYASVSRFKPAYQFRSVSVIARLLKHLPSADSTTYPTKMATVIANGAGSLKKFGTNASAEVDQISRIIHGDEVVLFSKTFCPYCARVCTFIYSCFKIFIHCFIASLCVS